MNEKTREDLSQKALKIVFLNEIDCVNKSVKELKNICKEMTGDEYEGFSKKELVHKICILKLLEYITELENKLISLGARDEKSR